MKRSLRITLLFLSVPLVALLVWAVARSGSVDSGLFNESGCKAPCWHQLVPGKSTSGDVEHFVEGLSRIQWPERQVRTYNSGCRWTRVIGITQLPILDFYVENGKLTFIQSWRSANVTLGQVVEHFGSPEYVRAVLAVGPDGSLYTLEAYYPEQGLSFEVSPSQHDVGQIKANMAVDVIHYSQPGDLLSYFTTRYSCDLGQKDAAALAQETIEKSVQPWPGFGPVQTIQTH